MEAVSNIDALARAKRASKKDDFDRDVNRRQPNHQNVIYDSISYD